MMKKRDAFERYLNIRSAHTPAWLSDDQRIAFLSDISGTPQVWAVDSTGGWPDQLTFFQDKVWTLNVSPSGDRFICTRDTGGNERYQLYLGAHDGTELHRLSKAEKAIYHFGAWSSDGSQIAYVSNARNGTHFDVYIQNVDTGDPQLVYKSSGNYRVIAWSPDDSRLLLQNGISSAHQPLYILSLADKQVKSLTPEKEPVDNEPVRWASDGNVYLITNQDREHMNPARIDVLTGRVTYLENFNCDLESLAVSPDGRTLAFTRNENGYSKLCLYDLDSKGSKPITGLPSGIVAEPTFSKNGSYIAVSVQSPRHNLNIWTVDNHTLACKQVTQSSVAGIVKDSFVEPELIHFNTFDRRNIPAFYYRPQNEPSPYPVILYVHGGPASQIRPDFDPRFQYFLNRGYAILAPNVRGSSGYGKTYMALDDVEKRMDSVTDLKYAVKWLNGNREIDPDRIAIYGRSYGGFMVLAAVTTFPDLWAAAIDVVGIVNWVTFLENTGTWRRAHREQEYGSLDADRKFLESISPIHKLNLIEAPIMVVHGANDPRVPATEADHVVDHLRKRNHPVEYLRYEDEGHKISKISNRIDSFTKMAAFLDHHL
jgi:dipeptidyl aminopeptidase/acylaminoacyl peptidase